MDPGRKYGTCVSNNTNKWKCIFCMKETNGGISRLKHHLVGGNTSVTVCPNCPEHVRAELQNDAIKKAEERAAQSLRYEPVLNDGEADVEVEPKQKANPNKRKKRGPLDRYVIYILVLLDHWNKSLTTCSLFLDRFVTSTPPDILKGMNEMKRVLGACDKDLRDKTCAGIARWFYDAGIAFNAVTYDSFKEMTHLIAQYGMGLKPPSMHELRVPLLQREVAETHTMLLQHKNEWASKGCSLMSDGWRDSVVQKDIVNFLVNSPKGSVFMKSKEVSEVVKDATLLFKLLDEMVEEVGEKNVVQVITDNASNYVKAGKISSTILFFTFIKVIKFNDESLIELQGNCLRLKGQTSTGLLVQHTVLILC